MIDDMFQSATDAVGRDLIQRAKEPPKPGPEGFSFGGMLRGTKGLVAGAAESMASTAEILGGYGQVLSAYPAAMGVAVPLTDKQRKESAAARAKLERDGIEFNNPAGEALRLRGAEFMPDPLTSHASEQAVAGLFRFGGKAIGQALTLGPISPLTLAIDEGLTEADKLRQQGVDRDTRTKVGAIAGGVAGASIVLPVVGATAAKTAGLVVAGGPGGFMGQAAATQTILKNANYGAIADQYDPFDPVGLALSTIVPAGFGVAAHGLRARSSKLADVVLDNESRGQRYGKDGKILTSPKGAKGEMQVMDATATDPGFGVIPARNTSPDELARVGRDYLSAMERRYDGDPEKAMAAYNAGPGRLDAAIKAHGDNWLAKMPAETRAYVERGMRRLGDRQISVALRENPEIVDAARVKHTVETVDAMRLADDIPARNEHADAMERAHDQLAKGEDVNVSDLVTRVDPERLDRFRQDIVAKVADLPPELRAELTRPEPRPEPAPPETPGRQAEAKPAEKATEKPAEKVEATQERASPEQVQVRPRLELVKSERPDLPVAREGKEVSTLKQAVDDINKEFETDYKDAELAQVAAECFLAG